MATRLGREAIATVRGIARERGWTFDETADYLIDLGARRLESLKRYAKNRATGPKKKGRRIR